MNSQKSPKPRARNKAYKVMPDFSIRAYNPDTPDKRGISEDMIAFCGGVSPTLISARPPNVLIWKRKRKS